MGTTKSKRNRLVAIQALRRGDDGLIRWLVEATRRRSQSVQDLSKYRQALDDFIDCPVRLRWFILENGVERPVCRLKSETVN